MNHHFERRTLTLVRIQYGTPRCTVDFGGARLRLLLPEMNSCRGTVSSATKKRRRLGQE